MQDRIPEAIQCFLDAVRLDPTFEIGFENAGKLIFKPLEIWDALIFVSTQHPS
jgi:hypothetical protein